MAIAIFTSFRMLIYVPRQFFGVELSPIPPIPSSRWIDLTVVRVSIRSRSPRGLFGASGRTLVRHTVTTLDQRYGDDSPTANLT